MKIIPLTQGKVTLVDDADYEELSKFKWCAVKHNRNFYASRSQYLGYVNGKMKTKSIFMHRLLLKPDKGFVVDHLDGDGLNNQRYNIRSVTHRTNILAFRRKPVGASSKYRGVS